MGHVTVDLLVFEQRNWDAVGLCDLLELVSKVRSQDLVEEAFEHRGAAEPPDGSDEDDVSRLFHPVLVVLDQVLILILIAWVEVIVIKIDQLVTSRGKAQFFHQGFFNPEMTERVFPIVADDDQYIHPLAFLFLRALRLRDSFMTFMALLLPLLLPLALPLAFFSSIHGGSIFFLFLVFLSMTSSVF